MDLKKSFADEGVPIILFKKLANILSAPLAHITSICLQTGIFTLKWKIVDVIALPKGNIACLLYTSPSPRD